VRHAGASPQRGLIAVFAAGLVVASTRLAIAHDSGTSESSEPAASASQSDPSTPATGPEAYGAVPEMEWRKAHGLPRPSAADEVDFAAEGPVPWQAEACRKEGAEALGSTPLHCEATIAVTEGRLAPGAYSDEELRARFAAGQGSDVETADLNRDGLITPSEAEHVLTPEQVDELRQARADPEERAELEAADRQGGEAG
jgi:hypothetical protein